MSLFHDTNQWELADNQTTVVHLKDSDLRAILV
jgi:hypothetical protein